MPDNTDSHDFISKSDFQSLVAALKEEMAAERTGFEKKLDIQANQIHSSYQKKLKKLGLDEKEDEDSPDRRPTKRELELQSNVEKLLKQIETSDARTKAAERFKSVSETMTKHGVKPQAIDTAYTLLNARNVFSEDETGSLRMKVNVNGIDAALPLADAMKHFVKSDEGQLFVAPIGANGTGAKSPQSSSPVNQDNGNVPLYKQVNVDWSAVAHDQIRQLTKPSE